MDNKKNSTKADKQTKTNSVEFANEFDTDSTKSSTNTKSDKQTKSNCK
ncbi:MAG: hypothetical protein J6A07_03105 [Firmicutes bacterium]|nr:hypothetical protein [Bacillota bacterium]